MAIARGVQVFAAIDGRWHRVTVITHVRGALWLVEGETLPARADGQRRAVVSEGRLTSAGLAIVARTSRPSQRVIAPGPVRPQRRWHRPTRDSFDEDETYLPDDVPAVIERKFQAALADIRAKRRHAINAGATAS
jgi:hypothetical protein